LIIVAVGSTVEKDLPEFAFPSLFRALNLAIVDLNQALTEFDGGGPCLCGFDRVTYDSAISHVDQRDLRWMPFTKIAELD
jgi:hypothetical protein